MLSKWWMKFLIVLSSYQIPIHKSSFFNTTVKFTLLFVPGNLHKAASEAALCKLPGTNSTANYLEIVEKRWYDELTIFLGVSEYPLLILKFTTSYTTQAVIFRPYQVKKEGI
jgi:hypothetical protein